MPRTLFFLALLSGTALAQAADLPSGIPAEYQHVVTVLVGLLAAVLVQPLTALGKKLGRTQGVTTVAVSGVLSLLVALGFTLAQALATHHEQNLWGTLLIALVAFLKANGDYLTRVFANAKGAQIAAPVSETVPAPESGLESIR